MDFTHTTIGRIIRTHTISKKRVRILDTSLYNQPMKGSLIRCTLYIVNYPVHLSPIKNTHTVFNTERIETDLSKLDQVYNVPTESQRMLVRI